MPDAFIIESRPAAALLASLLMLTDLLAPRPGPGPPRRVAVPDVRGLFYSTCSGITGKLGFRITTVRLTEHPMPVEGLVVGQSPKPPARARRGSVLTVQVWHPPASLKGPRP
jgi:beta-lactam-binding protein with PASTA domain